MIARKFLVALIALAPVVAVAQWPDGPRPGGNDDGPRPRQFGRSSPTEKEIQAAEAFMKENAPNRWQAVEMLPDDGTTLQRNVMGFVVARYRMLQGMKEDDAKLYDVKVKQLRAEDEVYGLIANTTRPEEREKLRAPLEAAAQKLVELTLAEREQRIARLKEITSREEQNLASDRQQIKAQVAARTEALINEGQAALRNDMKPGGRREHRRATTQPGAEQAPPK